MQVVPGCSNGWGVLIVFMSWRVCLSAFLLRWKGVIESGSVLAFTPVQSMLTVVSFGNT